MKSVFISPEFQRKGEGISTSHFYINERYQMELMANELCKYLKTLGLNAVIGRTDYTIEELNAVDKDNTGIAIAVKRSDESNNGKFDYHVALHSDAGGGNARGPTVYYYDNQNGVYCEKGQVFAQSILDKLLGLYNRDNPGKNNRSNNYLGDSWIELGNAKAAGAYVEIAYHDNEEDARWIVSNRVRIAHAIGNGIYEHIQQKNSFIFPPRPKREVYISPDNEKSPQSVGMNSICLNREKMEKISRNLRDALKSSDIVVKLGDLGVKSGVEGENERVRESNASDYDLHVCIHARQRKDRVRGPEVYILPGDEKARKVALRILSNLHAVYNAAFPGTPKLEVVETNKYNELKNTNATAVLVRVACQSNSFDRNWMATKGFEIASAIGTAIVDTLPENGISKRNSYYKKKRVWNHDLGEWTKVPI
ncbi:MAG: N-acetylmuramoyl-L-alanine amidase [Oscillospiraceae bacterium]|nr:N-acetylmuramoyl-L-alanine amidase [Oscillospiraceae bacterium]